MRQSLTAPLKWVARWWLRYSEPGPAAAREPESQIAVAMFSTLTAVALVAAVLGWPFWVQKAATTFILLSLAAGTA